MSPGQYIGVLANGEISDTETGPHGRFIVTVKSSTAPSNSGPLVSVCGGCKVFIKQSITHLCSIHIYSRSLQKVML